MAVRIVLADDHGIVRDGLKAQLALVDGVEVIGEAVDGDDAVRTCRTLHPDVVVMDLGMPVLNGIEATRQLQEECPEIRVVVLSMHSEQRYVTEALHSGASAYVLKDSAFEELADALKTVESGGVYLSPRVQAAVVDAYAGRAPRLRGVPPRSLSPREREVLQLIAEGLNTKEVASQLCLSVKTVETHRRQVMHKTGANSVADLVRYAIREGITTLDQ